MSSMTVMFLYHHPTLYYKKIPTLLRYHLIEMASVAQGEEI